MVIHLLTQRFFTLIFWILSKFWFRLEVHGAEHLKGLNGPLVMVANHKSYIDAFLVFAAIPSWWRSPILPVRAMGNDGFFKNPFMRLLMHALGSYPSYRGQGLDISLKKPLEILKKDGVVGIYPEGKRIINEEIGFFKRGVGELARRAPGISILPISIHGPDGSILQVLPRPFKTIRINFGRPYIPNPSQSSETIAALLRDRIIFLYHSPHESLRIGEERVGHPSRT